jgi:heptosyltransferase II
LARYSNILVIQTAFIGDAILASSVIEKMHAAFPLAKVSVLVREGNESIYAGHPFLHEVLTWKKKENKLPNLFNLIRRIRRNKYDCVVNCHRYLSSGIIAGFSGARHIAGFKENPLSFLFNTTARHKIGDGSHETDRYHRLISDVVTGGPSKPRLYPSPIDREKVSPLAEGPFVCMAPASVWSTKQLPAEKWIELCNTMPASLRVYLIGAPADRELCESIRKQALREDITVLAGELSLLQSCALMSKARMNYVNDSAPLHLASSVNAPVTAFFCSTVPAFGFGPLSDRQEVRGVNDLPCRPCGLHGYRACPLKHFKCGHLMPMPAPPAADEAY